MNVLKHRHFVWTLFCWAYEQMFDVHCRCAPGCTFADTSPVVVVAYNVDVVANIHIHRCCGPYYFVSHMQVLADRLFSGENCKRHRKKHTKQNVRKKKIKYTNYDLMRWRKTEQTQCERTNCYAKALNAGYFSQFYIKHEISSNYVNRSLFIPYTLDWYCVIPLTIEQRRFVCENKFQRDRIWNNRNNRCGLK